MSKPREISPSTLQRDLDKLVTALGTHPFLVTDGVLYAPGTALANGSNTIKHKLGREPRGWLVLRSTGAAAALYEVSKDDRVITLSSTGTPTVELWFF